MSILVKPLITEKMTAAGEKYNRYGFIVTRCATKPQIRMAVEEIYGVKVERVNTIIQRGKAVSRYTKGGVISGQKNTVKKAIVFINKESKIDFYSNI